MASRGRKAKGPPGFQAGLEVLASGRPTVVLGLDVATVTGYAILVQDAEGEWVVHDSGSLRGFDAWMLLSLRLFGILNLLDAELVVAAEDWKGMPGITSSLNRNMGVWIGYLSPARPTYVRPLPHQWRALHFEGYGKASSDIWKQRAVERVKEMTSGAFDGDDNEAEAILQAYWFVWAAEAARR